MYFTIRNYSNFNKLLTNKTLKIMERRFLFFTLVKKIFRRNLKTTFSVVFGVLLVCNLRANPNASDAKSPVTPNEKERIAPQQSTLSGTVRDDTGAPVPGASIVLTGSPPAVTSDLDGNFALNLPAGNNILVVSYV